MKSFAAKLFAILLCAGNVLLARAEVAEPTATATSTATPVACSNDPVEASATHVEVVIPRLNDGEPFSIALTCTFVCRGQSHPRIYDLYFEGSEEGSDEIYENATQGELSFFTALCEQRAEDEALACDSSNRSLVPRCTPTPTATPTTTPTPLQSTTSTPTYTPLVVATATYTATPTRTQEATATPTASISPSPLPSATITATASPTPTFTPVMTESATPTSAGSPSQTPTPTPEETYTRNPEATSTATPTPTTLATRTRVPTYTPTTTPTPTWIPTYSPEPTETPTATPLPTKIPDEPLGYNAYVVGLTTETFRSASYDERPHEDLAAESHMQFITADEGENTPVEVFSSDQVLSASLHDELREEFRARFNSFAIVEAAKPNYLLKGNFLKLKQDCKNGVGPARAYKARFLTLEEFNYFREFLVPRLLNFAMRDAPRCFALEPLGVNHDQYIKVCIHSPTNVQFKKGYKWAEEMYGFCLDPYEIYGSDTFAVFKESAIDRSDDITSYAFTPAQQSEFLRLVGNPAGKTNREKLGEILYNLPQNLQMWHLRSRLVGRWETYVAVYIQLFGSGEPLLDLLANNDNQEKLCNHLEDKKKFSNPDVHWQDLYTTFFGAWFATQWGPGRFGCIRYGEDDPIPTIDNHQQYYLDSIQGLTGPSFTHNIMVRHDVAAWFNSCKTEVFPQLIGQTLGDAYCFSKGVLDWVPVAGTFVGVADFVDTCARKDCAGTDAKIQLASLAVGVFLGRGAPSAAIKAQRSVAAAMMKTTRAFVRNPSRASRVALAQTLRFVATSLRFIPSRSRALQEAIENRSVLIEAMEFATAKENVVKNLKDIIGDTTDILVAEQRLRAAGFTVLTPTIETGLNGPVRTQVLHIYGITGAAAAGEWSGFDKYLNALRMAGQKDPKRAFKFYVDISKSNSDDVAEGAFVPGLKAILMRPERVTVRGVTDMVGIHETDHLVRMHKSLRGALSSYLVQCTGPLGSYIQATGTSYAKRMNLDELKTLQLSLLKESNELRAFLKANPQLRNSSLFELALFQNEFYNARVAPLLGVAKLEGAIAWDLENFARLVRDGSKSKAKVAYLHYNVLMQHQANLPEVTVLPPTDLWYAFVVTPEGNRTLIPLIYGTKMRELTGPLLAQGLSPADAVNQVMDASMRQRADQWLTSTAKAKEILGRLLEDRGGKIELKITTELKKLGDFSDDLSRDIRELRSATREIWEFDRAPR